MKCQQLCVRTLNQNVWTTRMCHCMPRSYSRTPSFSPGVFSLSTHHTPSFSPENKCPFLHFPPKNIDHSSKPMLSSSAKVGMRFGNAKSPADKKNFMPLNQGQRSPRRSWRKQAAYSDSCPFREELLLKENNNPPAPPLQQRNSSLFPCWPQRRRSKSYPSSWERG